MTSYILDKQEIIVLDVLHKNWCINSIAGGPPNQREKDIQIDIQIDRLVDRETEKQIDRHKNIYIDRQIDR